MLKLKTKSEFLRWGLPTITAILVIFFRISYKSYWLDEILNLRIAQMSWEEMAKVLTSSEPYRWFYYLLLHGWMKLMPSNFDPRWLSAILAVPSVPLIYFFGKNILGKRVGQIAAWLMVMNGMYLNYAQEVHSYSLLLTLSLFSSYLLIKLINKPRTITSFFYVLSAYAALFTHHFALVLVLVQIFIILLSKSIILINKLVLIALIAIAILPYIYFVIPAGNISWIEAPSAKTVIELISNLSGGHFVLALFLLPLVFLALWQIAKKIRIKTLRLNQLYLCLWLFVPCILSLLISLFLIPILVPRYLIVVLPAYLLLSGYGLTLLRRSTIKIVYFALIISLSTFNLLINQNVLKLPLVHQFVFAEKENWRDVTNYLITKTKPEEKVIFYAYFTRLAYEYYQRQISKSTTALVVDIASEAYPIGGQLPSPNWEVITNLTKNSPTLWLVLSHYQSDKLKRADQAETLIRFISKRCISNDTVDFTDIKVIKFNCQP